MEIRIDQQVRGTRIVLGSKRRQLVSKLIEIAERERLHRG